jgi:hypothetical protein
MTAPWLPALYQGVSAAVLGSAISWGLYFFIYENAKQRWQPRHEGAAGRPALAQSAWQARASSENVRSESAQSPMGVRSESPLRAHRRGRSRRAWRRGWRRCSSRTQSGLSRRACSSRCR